AARGGDTDRIRCHDVRRLPLLRPRLQLPGAPRGTAPRREHRDRVDPPERGQVRRHLALLRGALRRKIPRTEGPEGASALVRRASCVPRGARRVLRRAARGLGHRMSAPRTLLKLEGVTKDFPKVATGGQRLRTLLALAFRRGELPHFRALEGIDL